MTRAVWTCWHHDHHHQHHHHDEQQDGGGGGDDPHYHQHHHHRDHDHHHHRGGHSFQVWRLEHQPGGRENEKPFTDSERTQRWRLSLASLLFLTILLSDHLWFCAEAKHRDKFSSSSGGDNMPPGAHHHHHHHHHPSSLPPPPPPSSSSSSSPQTRLAHSISLRGITNNPHENIFIGNNSTKHLWRLETCHHHHHHHDNSLSKDCFTFGDADTLCQGLSDSNSYREEEEGGGGGLGGGGPPPPPPRWTVNMGDLYLSFCNSYSLLDLFNGSTSPDNLNCSLSDVLSPSVGGDTSRCSLCVQAYQRYDMHAQEKYEDFELMTLKYETDAYSVRTCMEQCKMAYKPWLCAQYFPTSQTSCQKKVPCHQYCLEVQQSCPYILPDNDDLIQGGSPSFICTGLLGDRQPESEAECCDVRWDAARVDHHQPSGGTLKRTPPPPAAPCQPQGGATGVTSAAAATPRLCGGRLKFCLLALVLLHTVIVIHTTASHNSTGVAGDSPSPAPLAAFTPEETAASSEE